ncbi:VOC family protein [Actinoplanes sp. NPDC023936]|uniref:VOC family protein n=1 Tax=Actinoplanes sp. NPDC023936 TaxID=3154910 RepID=UPI0033C4B18E
MLDLAHITFDCSDAAELAGFWAEALGRPVDDGAGPHVATIGAGQAGPTLMFLRVDEPKTAKNRCHLDLTADDRDAEVKRLVRLGATYRSTHDEWGHSWVVLHDPAGNEFCVAQRTP